MQKTVLIRQPQLHGNVNRMVRATVLSEQGDTLRVVPTGSNKPIEVKASDVMDAPKTFGTHLAMHHGIVVQRAWPDSPSSLSRIIERRAS